MSFVRKNGRRGSFGLMRLALGADWGLLMGNQSDHEDDIPAVEPEQQVVQSQDVVEPSPHVTPISEVILSTRASRAWVRLLPALVVLVVILVFVFQNPKDVKVSILTFSGTLPLSVAILGSVILGVLMTLALGSVRILQLRRQLRRKTKESKGSGRHFG